MLHSRTYCGLFLDECFMNAKAVSTKNVLRLSLLDYLLTFIFNTNQSIFIIHCPTTKIDLGIKSLLHTTC